MKYGSKEGRGKFPHRKAKIKETLICQTKLAVIYLISVNISLIMKVLRKFK